MLYSIDDICKINMSVFYYYHKLAVKFSTLQNETWVIKYASDILGYLCGQSNIFNMTISHEEFFLGIGTNEKNVKKRESENPAMHMSTNLRQSKPTPRQAVRQTDC